MSDQVFMLPDLGEGLADAEIVEWKVAVGDTVEIDQVIVEVETAKASVEVPVPFAGVVLQLHGAVGDVMNVGSPLISVSAAGGAAADSASAEQAAFEQYREEERAGSGNVLIGYGTSESPSRRRRRVNGSAPAAPAPGVPAPAAPAAKPQVAARVISPIVRALALSHGLDLDALTASSANGIITRADVERAIAGGTETASAAPAPVAIRTHAQDVRIPLTGLRRVVADKLSTSRREIPDATTWVDVDATGLVEARRAINASTDNPISLLALLGRLTVAALAKFPELNSSVDTATQEIVRYAQVNLGIAAQTPKGLMVPVIHQADQLTTIELNAELRDTTALARDGKLPPSKLTGGTFTLNNYGVFGTDGSTPIINHPEAAILGIGRIIDRPWVVDGQIVVRKVTQLSLTFDHRVCDGGSAGGFLRLFADYVENPVTALGNL